MLILDEKIEKTIEKILLNRISERKTIYYSELAREVNKILEKNVIPEKGKILGLTLSKFLHKLCEKSFKKEKKMIGAVVVNKQTNIPSDGFFKFAEKLYNRSFKTDKEKRIFWESEIKKLFKG